MLSKIFQFYAEYDDIINWIFNFIITTGFGLGLGHISKIFKRRRLKRFFHFKKDTIDILIPERNGTLTLSSNDSVTEITDTFVTKGEMDAAIAFQSMLLSLGLSPNVSIMPTENKTNNIVCLGGPLSNATTAHYIRTKFSHFTFGVHKDSHYLSERNREKLAYFVHEDDKYNEIGHSIRTVRLSGKEILSFDPQTEGYVFLAKLSEKIDLKGDNNGAIYLFFGNNSTTTLGIIKSFQKNLIALNKLLKGKKRYCVIIKCDEKGNLYFDEENCKDLTDAALLTKTAKKKKNAKQKHLSV